MTAIAVIAGLVALVWGAAFVLRGSLLGGCLAYLALTCCFSSYFFSFDVGGVTLSIDRLFLVALVGAWFVQWRLGNVDLKPLGKIDILVVGFAGVLTVSQAMHPWTPIAGDEAPALQHLINGYLIPLSLYFVARQSKLTEQNVSAILPAAAAFGVYLAATGLLEAAGQWGLVFPRYIANPKIGLHFGRARGPMVQSVSYGVYLGACLVAVWLWREPLLVRAKGALSRISPRRWLPLVIAPLILAAIYCTKTRTVWMGAGTALVAVLWGTLHGKTRYLVLGAMVFAALIVGVVKMDAILGLKREGTAADTRRSASMRPAFAYVSIEMFKDRPLFGFGFGQFAREKLPYLSDRSVDLDLESIREYVHHNTFLSVLTETGLVGMSLFLAVLAGWFGCGLALAQHPIAPPWMRRHGWLLVGVLCVMLWQMTGHEVTFTTIDNSLLYLLAGIAVGLRSMLNRGDLRAFAPAPYVRGRATAS
jgi:O-antigen ligase